MRILYVEDEEMMRDVFLPLIRGKVHCDLVEAHSGNQAIQILKNDPNFDLIVSDYKMADGNGAELLEYVSREGLTPYFILFTNTISPEINVYNEKFLGIIHKFEFKQLFSQIQNVTHLIKSLDRG